ncbi:DUF2799 domain-containing protein [Acinetobacter sp. 1125_18A]|uniref:DUF2799 domain-containing protein n=1 Tax=Acinetobacter sp. 1125_18A TaxID=2605959 RepID=UPI0040587F84
MKFTLGSIFLLSGCASMSPQECQTANWFIKGEEDGSNGQYSRLATYHKACNKINIIPNQSEYEHGYRMGLENYCQAKNIFAEAQVGRGDYRVCPSEYRLELIPYYNVAKDYYEAKKKYESDSSKFEQHISNLNQKNNTDIENQNYKQKYDELKNQRDNSNSKYQMALFNLQQFKFRNNL